ncbi:hypothetical protein AMTR_s00085p00129720 [Amborella trichopoda]|uniref:Uncharacterized protein n=1 Tax=Amborella trichopoda TaxID=13333 RepID=W1NYP4_AMBTC|nr:hypothetical protein AMTR_s00085p00129720 [Amborella trichopoda]
MLQGGDFVLDGEGQGLERQSGGSEVGGDRAYGSVFFGKNETEVVANSVLEVGIGAGVGDGEGRREEDGGVGGSPFEVPGLGPHQDLWGLSNGGGNKRDEKEEEEEE